MNMETLELVLRVLLVLDALALIGLVLLQQGRGASMGAAFGSGASTTMFGSVGASGFLTRLTTYLAVGFFVLTFALAWSAKARNEAALDLSLPKAVAPAAELEVPVVPEESPADAAEVPEAP